MLENPKRQESGPEKDASRRRQLGTSILDLTDSRSPKVQQSLTTLYHAFESTMDR
jgi:hypothetical protein